MSNTCNAFLCFFHAHPCHFFVAVKASKAIPDGSVVATQGRKGVAFESLVPMAAELRVELHSAAPLLREQWKSVALRTLLHPCLVKGSIVGNEYIPACQCLS